MDKKMISPTDRKATSYTRGVIYLLAIGIFMICAILLPEIAREEKISNPNAGPALPFLIAAWIMSFPIFAALYEAYKITTFIDNNSAFSKATVKAMQHIKKYAIILAFMIAAGAMSIIIIGKSADPSEDVAPFITLGFVFTFAISIIAAFSAVLEKLLIEALQLKEENDSIV